MTVGGDLNVDRLNTFLGGLIALIGPDLYRYKGICAIAEDAERFVFQVGHPCFVKCSHVLCIDCLDLSLSGPATGLSV